MKLFHIILLVLVFLVYGCNGKNISSANTDGYRSIQSITQAEQLFSGKRLNALQYHYVSEGMSQEIKIDKCAQDDEILLYEDGTFMFEENDPCEHENTDSSGTWKVGEHKGKFFINFNDNREGRLRYEIVAYANNIIKLKWNGKDDRGRDYDLFAIFRTLGM